MIICSLNPKNHPIKHLPLSAIPLKWYGFMQLNTTKTISHLKNNQPLSVALNGWLFYGWIAELLYRTHVIYKSPLSHDTNKKTAAPKGRATKKRNDKKPGQHTDTIIKIITSHTVIPSILFRDLKLVDKMLKHSVQDRLFTIFMGA